MVFEGIQIRSSNRLGNPLTEKIADAPSAIPHKMHLEDRAVYWFYKFHIQPEAFKCGRFEFTKAVLAGGVSVQEGSIKVPLYGEPVFQNHGFFAKRWPVKEMGLTDMDCSKHKCPTVKSLPTEGNRVPIYE